MKYKSMLFKILYLEGGAIWGIKVDLLRQHGETNN